jgi:hypothetical protein
MVYLVKENDKVRVFYSENDMKAAGFKKVGLSVTEEQFNSNGCYARLIDGDIVVGKTTAEIAEEERQIDIAGCKAQLEAIDHQAGASRLVRDACFAVANMGVLLGITDQQIAAETDPAKKAAMRLLKGLDPATHQGLEKLVELESQAGPIREQLGLLLTP